MENDEILLIKLRDCFTGGYTLPQYCIDNDIKKPLFVSEEKFLTFTWEIHVQFRYDKRIFAEFSFLDLPSGKTSFALGNTTSAMSYQNFSEINLADFDAIILLTEKNVEVEVNTISLENLCNYFFYKTYAEIPTLNFLQRYPQVKFFLTYYPIFNEEYNNKSFNKQLMHYPAFRRAIRASKHTPIETTLDKFGYTNRQLRALIKGGKAVKNFDGSSSMIDNNDPLVRIKDGKRETADQPEHFRNKIYICGTCHDYGVNAPFDKTIASYLQKMLNEANLPYRVENESQRYGSRYQDIFYNLNNIEPLPGDIIFLYIHSIHSNNQKRLPFLDLLNAFSPPLDFREFFCARNHLNELGYKTLAEGYFKFLTENNFFRDKEFNYPTPPPHCIATESLHSSRQAAAM